MSVRVGVGEVGWRGGRCWRGDRGRSGLKSVSLMKRVLTQNNQKKKIYFLVENCFHFPREREKKNFKLNQRQPGRSCRLSNLFQQLVIKVKKVSKY